ncbi:DUF2867 domain-containing protein [Confluentibacter lentus]|uniref:DUF2867 domain-containing protein n=1 Tax=Confluentibacter lentus TaxID=1699412 RepID=UPI000C28F48A|nr:DUF2867 domain-containing protein [Confluentibacter lentus]
MKILKSTLPNTSILKPDEKTFDYIDSFESVFIDTNDDITSTKIGKSFFMSGPKWVDTLFAFRNKLVGLFGLKTSGTMTDRQKMLDNFKGEKGEQIGLFKVLDKTTDEIILGEDDKHLNFRVSLFVDQQSGDKTHKKLIISTTVKFNNWFGRLYFLPVRPFHKLIVPTMLKGIIRHVEN